jgi:hypothetical protein
MHLRREGDSSRWQASPDATPRPGRARPVDYDDGESAKSEKAVTTALDRQGFLGYTPVLTVSRVHPYTPLQEH